MLFNELGLSAELLRAVEEKGYRETTAVQQQAIPLILAGRDVLAGAQTGTGKTAAFALPLLAHLQTSTSNRRRVRALVLTPTRELAAQVADSVRAYGSHLPFRTATIFGGVSINPQIDKLRRGVDVIVATPGRLLDHLGQKTVDLSGVEVLVLDEADRMLDMGFIRDMRKIFAVLPRQRQTLMFSATFSDDIRRLAADQLDDPVAVQVTPRNTAVERVSQVVHPVDRARKRELLSHLIGTGHWKQVLVFTRTKHGANRLAQQLNDDGIVSSAIHGNKSQGARTRALADFKQSQVRVLVATDIAARGLDIERLPHVVNYELPHVAEDYVHRIGRTARAGQDGQAVSLVCVDEKHLLGDIERLLNGSIEKRVLAGFEPDPRIKAEALQKGRPARGGNRGAPGGSRQARQRKSSPGRRPSRRQRTTA